MLILTRKEHESILIGDDVTVTILGQKGKQVRIGVQAPPDTKVLRQEVLERIKLEEKRKEDAA